jgi:UDP-hydrolysing UDP-N-acetyl-D-glucosamine 2-epimerase
MSTARRIFFLTAARSEYDLLYPVARAAAGQPGLAAEIVAAAAHLSPFHGMGIEQIRADGFPIAGTLETLLCSESWQGRAISFANLIEGLTRLLARDRPDVLFVAGDREEALAGALVANFLGIPLAHAHGGDRCCASELDEVLRPAISKLAHLHFAATEGHRERLIRMGEVPERVWTVGATGLDRLRDSEDVPAATLNREFGVDVDRPFFILICHPSPLFGAQRSGEEMRETLRGILSLGHPVFCSYPNFDPGNIAIREAIDEAKSKSGNLIVYHNLPRDRFVALYRRCAAIVGNSSSIVIEAGFLKVPGILVGPRQDLRERGPNVLRADISAEQVRDACRRAIEDEPFRAQVRSCPSLYGDGHAAGRIVKVLAEVSLDRELLLKTMAY